MIANLKGKSPLQWNVKALIFAFLGGFITIIVLSFLTEASKLIFIMAPFGASCVLAYAAWEAPLAQPRNIIGGHIITALTGIIILQIFGNSIWAMAAAVGLAIALMVFTKTTHPPAGANPIIIFTSHQSFSFLLFPVATGALIVTALAFILNRFVFRRDYPKFWY